MWRATALSLFPEMFPGPLGESLAGRALREGVWELTAVDIRGSARDRHRTVDDAPFGGGQGEDAFRSFLNEAMAKQIVHRGGVGLASTVEREMLHLQGLAPSPRTPAVVNGSASTTTFQQSTYGRRP